MTIDTRITDSEIEAKFEEMVFEVSKGFYSKAPAAEVLAKAIMIRRLEGIAVGLQELKAVIADIGEDHIREIRNALNDLDESITVRR